MTFDELLKLVSSNNAPALCVDSRLVKKGNIFVAIKGTAFDGHDFVDQALANGAKYIVCQRPETSCVKRDACREKKNTQYAIRNTQYDIIIVKDSAKAAATLAQASRGYPASRLTNLAITGTNGKTTVAFLVRSCIQKAGEKCGLISTITYDTGLNSCQATLTTPDCLDIAEMTEQMLKAGSKYMLIEASSHALAQNRLAGINFKAAAFTNLAGDHLDYHKTKADYLAAKTKLFKALSPDATAVLNKQSSEAEQIAREIRPRRTKILWYAIEEPAELTAHIEAMGSTGTVFTLETRATGHCRKASCGGSRVTVRTPLLGRFNVSNSLAAAGLCLAAGFNLETIAAGLSALRTIPGRLEKLDSQTLENGETVKRLDGKTGRPTVRPSNRPTVFIDYAHTDDALKNVLATLKPLCRGKLRVVFGCGGDRDRTKRPRMARVAEQLADFIIVTNDNPRTEEPMAIIEEVIAGFENGPAIPYAELRDTSDERRATKIIEPDRKKAIRLAIKSAAGNDIVLIAGKGHETYQIIGTQKFDFNDKDIAQECLAKRK